MATRLLALTVERFKSIYRSTRVEFGQLSVILGKNNSGKSSVIQVLLLLKQTLEFARVEIPLSLEGNVGAANLREITSGWPEEEEVVQGPSFSLEWISEVDVSLALEEIGRPDITTLMDKAQLPWISDADKSDHLINLYTQLDLHYFELKGRTVLQTIGLRSAQTARALRSGPSATVVRLDRGEDGKYQCVWNGEVRKKIDVDVHHFIPALSIDRRNVGPRDTQRSLANAFNVLFSQPLDVLEEILRNFSYLSSTRNSPPAFYQPAASASDDIGVSGEYAAQLLFAHRADPVHYLLPDFEDINNPGDLKEETLADAVNEVLHGLGIDTPLSIEEIRRVGFRLLFGRATLFHVGRGLTYLLPIVQLGLSSDPMAFRRMENAKTTAVGAGMRLCAFEEPESHLHPRVQSRLAAWFVALSQASRQVIVETHSDHLVRRLRSLSAQARKDSDIEKWISKRVRVISVTQDSSGVTRVESATIGASGGADVWPKDFMDVALEAEEDIFVAAMKKSDPVNVELRLEHMEEDEPSDRN